MLPPNPRVGGLPSNPRSSGPGGRQYRRERSSRDENSGPSRSHRSRPSPNERSRGQSSFDQTSRRSNDSSTSSSSVSSSGSYFLGRMTNGTSGYSSSITTIEDDYEDDYRKVNGRGRFQTDGQENGSLQIAEEGYGQTIWSRVATAASSLTVNVSKAWASNIAIYAGEETPPGQDSRLTRAMKAYHLEKARDSADLPAWLFDEHERRRRPQHNARDADAEPRETKQASSPPRGLRDVYDAVSVPARIHQSSSAAPTVSNSGAPRKGTDRLRALREGKRANAYGAEEEGERPQAPKARVGLPGGPARKRQV